MYGVLFLLGLAAISADPGAHSPRPAPSHGQSHSPGKVAPDGWAGLRDKLIRALEQQRFDEALVLAKTMMAHPDFAQAPERDRRDLQYLVGSLTLQSGRAAAAVPYLEALVASPRATQDEWLTLTDAYIASRANDQAARAMTTLIQRFPESAGELRLDYRAQYAMRPDIDAEAGFALRQALFRSDWRYEHESWAWVKLVDELIDRDRGTEAAAVLARITDADVRVQTLALRRYDGVRPAQDRPDLKAVYEAELDDLRKAAAAPGATMADHSRVVQRLFSLGRYDETLAAVEVALALPEPGEDQIDLIQDATWIMDGRAHALFALGRVDEALEAGRLAAARPEYGSPNVNQTINLAWLHVRLDRPTEALALVEGMSDRDIGDFNLMRVHRLRACAAHAAGDQETVRTSLEWIRGHAAEGPVSLYDTLACIDDEEGMAVELAAMLADPERQEHAVALMHHYSDRGWQTDWDRTVEARYDRVTARPDLIAARDRIARRFDVPTIGAPI